MLGIELLEGTWCGEYSVIRNMVSVWVYAKGKYVVGNWAARGNMAWGICCKREYDVRVGICKREICCWGSSCYKEHSVRGNMENMVSVW